MIVRYDADYHPVDLIEWKQFTKVRIMIKRGPKFWKWSSIEGVIVYPLSMIIKVIKLPNIVSLHICFLSQNLSQ